MLEFLEPGGIAARGTLIVIPGRGEQPDVYRRFGARISADAYRVHVSIDPMRDSDHSQREIEETLTRDDTPHPVVIVGSDTGALFAAGLIAGREVADVDGLILAGLPQGADAGEVGSWDDELEARTTCPTHRGRISGEIVTRGALYDAIPQEFLDRADVSALSVPVLGIHGQQDPISSLATVRDRYAGVANVELASVAAARHDVLNDQSHRSVAATVILWLERLKRNGPELTAIVTPERVEEQVA
jgi:alpha-beta hydrolase superfamily lysophospholipase